VLGRDDPFSSIGTDAFNNNKCEVNRLTTELNSLEDTLSLQVP